MKRVLIVEDDESIAMLEKDYLSFNNFDVTVCNNGVNGLQTVESESFDLIVLDVMLPDIDGFRILETIRQTSNTPVLLVTAKSTEIDKIKGFGLGADDYITKPFNFNEFVARVTAHIKRYERLTEKAEVPTNKLVIRKLEIDLQGHQAFYDGNEIILANKEFELLAFLAQNPNKVFSKEKIMDVIWGYENCADTNTVTVHIRRIREKLEIASESDGVQFIETVWGAGYKFTI